MFIRFSDLFVLSTRMFKARTMRTFLTVLGMSIGIGAIIFLVSLGYGLQKTILEKITTSDSLLTLDVAAQRSSTAVLNEEQIVKIKETAGVAEVSPSFQLSSQGRMDDLTSDLHALVVMPSYMRLSGMKITEGVLINDEVSEGIVISTPVAKIFGKDPKEIIGKEMDFIFFLSFGDDKSSFSSSKDSSQKFKSDKKFKIIGVIESEDNQVYVNFSAVSEIKPPSYDQVKVKCNSQKEMGTVRDIIANDGFSVSSLSETVEQTNKIFTVVKMVLMLFGVIALVVSAIGMFNTMTITLLERTEEIGIMKSIGASDATISLIFIMESTIMGFLGGLVGVFIGILEGEVFNGAVNLIATHFGGEKVDLFYSPLFFISAVIIFSAVVGFLTGVTPARRASKIDPLDALRYK